MRCAIIADIHGNLKAFQAVLRDIKTSGGVERIWCLGDIVGYGPDPAQCIEFLHSINTISVMGNHDAAAAGMIDTDDFNYDAAAAIKWTSAQLSTSDKKYLGDLPDMVTAKDFTMVHGSPRDPLWEYLLTQTSAEENFPYFDTPYCIIGHSHMPLIFKLKGGSTVHISFQEDSPIYLEDRIIINPGSIGQPRDGDSRASYAIYDSDENSVCLRRVKYDIETTQRRMEQFGLPSFLIARLRCGQ